MPLITIPPKSINDAALLSGRKSSGSGGTSSNTTTTAGNDLVTTARVVYVSNVTQSGLTNTDGVTVAAGDVALCVGQTDAKQNGLWILSASGWSRTNYGLFAGHLVRILEGTTYGNSVWGCGNTVAPSPGVDNITYSRKDANTTGLLIAANNLSDLVSVSAARTNLGLGTIATQAANNVSISGGQITGLSRITVTGSNSTMSVGTGNSATITAVSSGSVNLQSGNANLRVLQDRIDGSMSSSTGSLIYLQATSGSNASSFIYTQRTRNAGTQNIAIETQSVTNSGLNILDSVTWMKRITPNTGTQTYNYLQSVVIDTSSSTPATAEDIFVTHAGLNPRAMRIQSGIMRLYQTGNSTLHIGLAVPTLSASYTITLPTAAAQSGQTLQSDGTGQLFWVNDIYKQTEFVTSNQTMAANKHYVVTGSSGAEIALTLPTNANTRAGDYLRVTRRQGATNTWRVSQNAGQQIRWNNGESTLGTTGYAQSNSADTSMLLMCMETDSNTFSTWQIIQQEGLPLLV